MEQNNTNETNPETIEQQRARLQQLIARVPESAVGPLIQFVQVFWPITTKP